MATTTAKSGQPIHNNGGIVPRGGALTAGSPITSAPDNLTQGYTSRGVGGTVPVSSATRNIGTQKAVSGGVFARNMFSGQYVMFRQGYVGGTASTFLNSGAADFGRRNPHEKHTRKSYHITSWNYVTGVATTGAPTTDDFNTDNAATPTRAIPGEFVYSEHGMATKGSLAVPTMADYPARTD